jgi:hypothetical protein
LFLSEGQTSQGTTKYDIHSKSYWEFAPTNSRAVNSIGDGILANTSCGFPEAYEETSDWHNNFIAVVTGDREPLTLKSNSKIDVRARLEFGLISFTP